jgi:hypothetical protein
MLCICMNASGLAIEGHLMGRCSNACTTSVFLQSIIREWKEFLPVVGIQQPIESPGRDGVS